MSKISITADTTINIEVVRAAVNARFPGRVICRYSLKETNFGATVKLLLGATPDDDPLEIEATIQWPRGQKGYGSISLSFEGSGPVTYACWRDANGSVEVAVWSGPDLAHQCHYKYGVKYPRGKVTGPRKSEIWIMYCLVFFASFVCLVYVNDDFGKAIGEMGGLLVVVGLLFFCYRFDESSRASSLRSAWVEEEKRVDWTNPKKPEAAKESSAA